MKYLHNSPVKFHGNLTSRHCMIDNHWVVSITDWGLNKFKAGQERIYTDTNKTSEGMYVIDYSLWTGKGSSGCGSKRSYEPFRYKFVQSRWTVSRHWFKKRRVLTHNVFVVHAQTILEVNEIFVQSHCLSSYRNDFESKWPVSTLRMDGDTDRQSFAPGAFVETKIRVIGLISSTRYVFSCLSTPSKW